MRFIDLQPVWLNNLLQLIAQVLIEICAYFFCCHKAYNKLFFVYAISCLYKLYWRTYENKWKKAYENCHKAVFISSLKQYHKTSVSSYDRINQSKQA